MGLRFQEALHRLGAGEPLAAVFADVRGLFYLAGVGVLFAALDAVRPGDTAFFRDVMALFNTATLLAVFVLARRLSGSFAGGLAGAAAAPRGGPDAARTARRARSPRRRRR